MSEKKEKGKKEYFSGLNEARRLISEHEASAALNKEATQKLVESVSLLNSFFNSPGAMRGVIEVEGNDIRHIVDNSIAAEFFGRTQESMIDKLASEMGVDQEFIDIWIKHYEESKHKKQQVNFEYEHKADRQSHFFSVTVNYLGESDRGFSKYTYVLFDITEHKQAQRALQKAHDELDRRVEQRTAELAQSNTQLKQEIEERKKAEAALKDSEKKYRSVFTAEPDAIILVDAKTMQHLDANDAALKLYGYEREEFLSLHSTDISAETEKTVKRITSGFETVPFRYHRKKDGTIFPVEISASFFELSGRKTLCAAIRDITERKQAEDALRESEEKYRQLFEMESDAILLIRKNDGRILEVNAAGSKLYGFSREELLKMKNTDVSVEPDLTQKATMEQEREILIRYHRKKDGTVFPVEITASHLTWQGQEVHIAAIRDISFRIESEKEKIKLEEQLRQSHKMEAIGTLAGGIAHDFNNMLGIILGNTELAMDDVPEWNPARFNLEEIKTASLRAKDVVRQLLSFARKTDRERKPVEINTIVTGGLKLLRSSIPTSTEIRSNIPKKSQIIFADPTQINQVMINLCTNAVHAMEEDGGVIEISLDSMTLDESTAQSYELSPGRYVKLTVNDTGHGIDPEIKDRIFDPYFTTREVGKGSGMGLSVVHGIVTNHDGAISVDSEVGEGTNFNIFFPIIEREMVPELIIDKDLPIGKEAILFVDDEESILKMGHQLLERLGYKVESTTSPIEALDLFRSKSDQFDLVITDLTMPKMTGDKMVKEILNIRPDMPIIICTGFSVKMDGERARDIGASGYLEKPHEKRILARMVRQVLDGKER